MHNKILEGSDFDELDRMANEANKEMEKIIGVPYDNKAEDYVWKRYPIRYTLDLYQIKELAMDRFGVTLSDSDIEALRNMSFDRGFILAVENETEDCIRVLLNQKEEQKKLKLIK